MISAKHLSHFTGAIAVASVLATALAGCSTVPIKPEASAGGASAGASAGIDTLIAQDFVNTMIQIDSLNPASTVLLIQPVINKDNNAGASPECLTENFAQAFKAAASKQGYTFIGSRVNSTRVSSSRIKSTSAATSVSFSAVKFDDSPSELACTYDLSVGEVDFRRVYMPGQNASVTPLKSMLVRGADVSEIESDDSIFASKVNEKIDHSNAMAGNSDKAPALNTQSDQLTAAANTDSEFDSPVARNDAQRREKQKADELELVEGVTEELPASEEPLLADAQLTEDEVADDIAALGLTITSIGDELGSIETSDTSVRNSNGFVNVRKKNIADSGFSNFEAELADKQNVAEEILIFGDDSYVLGARNKQLLGDMMDSFDPETDVVSVVGCSTGVTQIENGNAALAIGRANRVKEALLYSGVPHDKIFEEGCWSPTPNSTPFPNRGVVITVKRASDEG